MWISNAQEAGFDFCFYFFSLNVNAEKDKLKLSVNIQSILQSWIIKV